MRKRGLTAHQTHGVHLICDSEKTANWAVQIVTGVGFFVHMDNPAGNTLQ